jgi:high-affinity iron transporter
MLGALIIVFREVIEAGLIIGIVLAVTRGVPGRGQWVTAGVLVAALGAGLIAIFAETIANAFAGSGQEMFNASVLGVAVVMLMWHNLWMASHGQEMAASMAAVGAAVTSGQRPMAALALVVGLATLREGSEVVLFLYGIVAAGASASSLLLGGALGLAAGAAFTALTYYGLLAIPSRYIFTVTTVLITLLAAGMTAQAVQFLDAAGLIDVLGHRLWDSSGWLPQDSIVGRLLHTLIGYTDRPTELQLIAYIATLAIMTALTRISASTRSARKIRRQTTADGGQRTEGRQVT